jgi:DNA-binding response OmpR family regulator
VKWGTKLSDTTTTQFTVLLYSDDAAVRDRIRLAIGTRPAMDLSVEFTDASTWEECRRLLDEYEIDLMVLDGEAAPAGGLGIARQTKDEYQDPPPTCVVIARAADRWLAAYAQVDATLLAPLDPVTTGQTVAGLLRARRDGAVPLGALPRT